MQNNLKQNAPCNKLRKKNCKYPTSEIETYEESDTRILLRDNAYLLFYV